LKPVQLPEDLIRKPITHLRDLKLGESAWINWNDMVVDSDRNCFLGPEAKIHEETGLSIRVTRIEAQTQHLCHQPQSSRFFPLAISHVKGSFGVKIHDFFPWMGRDPCFGTNVWLTILRIIATQKGSGHRAAFRSKKRASRRKISAGSGATDLLLCGW
jgi:hypothetical protein